MLRLFCSQTLGVTGGRSVRSHRFPGHARGLQVAGMATSTTPAIPRPSASLIVINANNELLMVERHLESRSFAGAHVFPGGNLDRRQDDSLEMTAIRETFEETGVLLASPVPRSGASEISQSAVEDARKLIHSGKLLFKDFLSKNGLEVNITSLLPFSRWVTPPTVPRRFRTQFFVTFLPVASAVVGPTSGKHVHRIPSPDSPDDANSSYTEVASAQFAHPRDTLAAFSRGEIGLMPPQFYILTLLRDVFGSGEDSHNTPSKPEEVARVSRGTFGRMEFNPRPLPGASRDAMFLVLEGDETRGGRDGQLHRVKFYHQKGSTLPRKLELLRSFDVLNDSESAIALQSKL